MRLKHILKWLFCENYREATQIADEANRRFAEIMKANKSIMEGKK